MRRIQGIRNDRGYTELRIWLGPKQNPTGSINKPYRKIFGPWSNINILRAKEHMEKVRRDFKMGKLPTPDPLPILVTQASDLFYQRHFVSDPSRSLSSKRPTKSIFKTFKRHWPDSALHLI